MKEVDLTSWYINSEPMAFILQKGLSGKIVRVTGFESLDRYDSWDSLMLSISNTKENHTLRLLWQSTMALLVNEHESVSVWQ